MKLLRTIRTNSVNSIKTNLTNNSKSQISQMNITNKLLNYSNFNLSLRLCLSKSNYSSKIISLSNNKKNVLPFTSIYHKIYTLKHIISVEKLILKYDSAIKYEDFLELFEIKFHDINNEKIEEQIQFWHHSILKVNSLLCDKQLNKDNILHFITYLNFFQPKVLKQMYIPEEIRNPFYSKGFNEAHMKEYFNRKTSGDIVFQEALNIKKHLFSFSSLLYKAFKDEIKETYEKPREAGINTNQQYQINNNQTIFGNYDFIKNYGNNPNKKLEDKYAKELHSDIKIQSSINDISEIYHVFFQNVEKKFIDDVYYGRTEYSFEDCAYLIQAFGLAKEGTNMFYEVLMRKISKNFEAFLASDLHDVSFKKQMIQIIINYLPHELYNINKFSVLDSSQEGKYVENGITGEVVYFYETLFSYLSNGIDSFDNKFFLNTMQGLFRISFINEELLNAYFDSFVKRLIKSNDNINTSNKETSNNVDSNNRENNSNDHDDINSLLTISTKKEFVFKYIEILTYFLKQRQSMQEESGNAVSYKIISQLPIIEQNFFIYINDFNMKEIATIFWFCYSVDYVDDKLINKFDARIRTLLNLYLIEFEEYDKKLSKLINKKQRKEYMSDPNKLMFDESKRIDNYDLEAILFFTSNYSYHPTIKFIKNCLITLKSDYQN